MKDDHLPPDLKRALEPMIRRLVADKCCAQRVANQLSGDTALPKALQQRARLSRQRKLDLVWE